MNFDAVLKELFRPPGTRLVRHLAGGEVTGWMNVEVPATRSRRPDLLGRLADGKAFHLELQATNDPTIHKRMLEYYVDIWSACGKPPRQVMLYVGKAAMQMTGRVEQQELHYSFPCVDIRQIPAGPLLESRLLEDNLLAILCRGGNEGETLARVMRRIARLEGRSRGDAMAKLLVLSGLRSIESEVRREIERMPIEIDVMENAVLREMILERQAKGREEGRQAGREEGRQAGREEGRQAGREEGRQAGREEGRQAGRAEAGVAILTRLLKRKFGDLPAWVSGRLQSSSADQLELWAERLIDAKSVDELFRS